MSITEICAVIGIVVMLIANISVLRSTGNKHHEAYGKLNQKVEDIRESLNGVDGRTGLIEKVDIINRNLSRLEGEWKTYLQWRNIDNYGKGG